MTDNMVNRIALAICKSRHGEAVNFGDIADARAALRAMRKPTEAMKDAAHEAMGSGVNRPKRFSPSTAGFVWEQMVEFALRDSDRSAEGGETREASGSTEGESAGLEEASPNPSRRTP